MDFILEHKWIFLIIAEVVFWISMLTFLILRYWFRLQKVSMVFFALFIVNDLWIATMGFFDYLQTGEFTSYQIIVLILIVYAFTYGKSDFKKLDLYIHTKIAAWKGEQLPEKEKIKKLSGKEYAKQERKQFFAHLIIYMAVHVIFALLFGFSDSILQTGSAEGFLEAWFDASDSTIPFNNISVNNVSRIWTLILVIDGIISLSYTLFPKREKGVRG